jgi:DNA-binding response OmpR family regulator
MSLPPTAHLPATVAVVDPDALFAQGVVAALQAQGVAARWFADAESLLTSDTPFDHQFYLLEQALPGLSGASLLQVLRRRSQAGALVLAPSLGAAALAQALAAGADMGLAKPVPLDLLVLAMRAVYRRSRLGGLADQVNPAPAATPAPAPAGPAAWKLLLQARQLQMPDGQVIPLSANDVAVLHLLAQAPGHAVTRAALVQALGLTEDGPANLLAATIYRLRRRVERVFEGVLPLQSRAGVGYVFKAPLLLA